MMIVKMVRMDEMVRNTERKYLASEFSGLVEKYEEIRANHEWTIWKALALKKEIRETQEATMTSPAYLEEERVSYKKEMVREATKPLRDELEEVSGHREVFREQLRGVNLEIARNREEVELLHL